MPSTNDYWGMVGTVAPEVYRSSWDKLKSAENLFYELFEKDKFYLRLTWKVQSKVKVKKIYVPKRQYQKMFTGITFRIGGSKK